jgi:hypothetical protein
MRLRVAVLLLVPAFGVSSLDAAVSYRFQTAASGVLPVSESGVVVSDGGGYRVDFERHGTTGQPQAAHAAFHPAGAAEVTLLNHELKTYWREPAEPVDRAETRAYPSPAILGLVPGGKFRLSEKRFECQPSTTGEVVEGQPEQVVHLVAHYDAEVRLDGGGKVRGTIAVDATYRYVPGFAVSNPPWAMPRLRTTDAELDAKIAQCLSPVAGLPRLHEVRVSRTIRDGIKDVYVQTLYVLEQQAAAAVSPATFEVPAGYRFAEPVASAPGG